MSFREWIGREDCPRSFRTAACDPRHWLARDRPVESRAGHVATNRTKKTGPTRRWAPRIWPTYSPFCTKRATLTGLATRVLVSAYLARKVASAAMP